MFHEYREIINKLKDENAHFHKLFERHNELDKKVDSVEAGKSHIEHFDLEGMKKEKLKLKDEVYSIIMEYKKQQ